jgi:hypothetical protein
MEVQYSAVSRKGTEVLISVVFERNDHAANPALFNYGLGNQAVRDLPTFARDPKVSKLGLTTTLSIQDFVPVTEQTIPFYIYEGSNQNSGCGLAINFVLIEPQWVGEEHLKIFSLDYKPEYVAKSSYKTIIYQNIISEKMPNLYNATLQKGEFKESPVPGHLTHLPFLYTPETFGSTLGHLSASFLPVWRSLPKEAIVIKPEQPPSVLPALILSATGTSPSSCWATAS